MLRFITLILISILVGAEVDLFIPSFPELQQTFNLSPVMVQLTLSVNFIAYCVCSLFAGMLGDRFNRRHIILAGLFLFVLGSISCVFADHYSAILLGRCLQGVGAAGPAVLIYALVADEYPIDKQASLLGSLHGITALAMAFSPVLGSYINLYYGWRGNFVILLILGVICTAISYIAIPSKKGDPKVSLSLRAYAPLLTSPKMLSYVWVLSLMIAAYWLFVGMAPILYMQDLDVSLKHFGFYQGAIAFVFSSLSITSPWILQKFGQAKCFYFGKWVCIATALFTAVLVISGISHPMVITSMMLIFAIGAVFPINIMYPMALEIFENSKGRASALILAIRLIITAVLLEGVSYFYTGEFVPIGLTMLIAIILSILMIQKQLKQKWLTF